MHEKTESARCVHVLSAYLGRLGAGAFSPSADGHPAGKSPCARTAGISARSDEELEFGAIQVHSIETGSERIHLVVLEGQAYRASTPLEGEFSRLVFDPVRREFVPLLPSIRVELEDMGRLESIAEAIGANGAIPFKALGFAIIELPESVHPLDAVRRLQAPPFSLEAWIRVRGQRLSWR